MKNENLGVGYLNFNMILQRLKSKKYGPGKNMIKESDLLFNIRNVFRICEKYYHFDPLSMRISKILEAHFDPKPVLLAGPSGRWSRELMVSFVSPPTLLLFGQPLGASWGFLRALLLNGATVLQMGRLLQITSKVANRKQYDRENADTLTKDNLP